MYPTSMFGFVLVAAGILLVLRPERRFVALVVSLGAATLGSGVLSASVGIVNTLHYLRKVPPADQLEIAALGCAESFHNVVLALILVVLTALLASIAAARAARVAQPKTAT
ncbi:MAG: hypothetical protein DRI90_17140 [Deltaproteobacteria bacterium]|nr:MAG: hypothetical protein DRI90_17140 [Deltaproteobacteria bacterium]